MAAASEIRQEEKENKQKRVQVVFDQRAAEMLERLRESTGSNVADVIRDALGFYDWAREQQAEGKSIAVVDHGNNRVREFILPFRK